MDKLYIFPYSGSGLEVLDCIDDVSQMVFISDNPEHVGQQFHGVPIISFDEFQTISSPRLICVHGSTSSYKNRLEVLKKFSNTVNWQTVIHPRAIVSRYATIGKNVFIAAGVSIGPNTIIEDHVIILANATIHHDSCIGSGSIICGNTLIAGNVTIGNEVYVGAGVTVKNGIELGSGSLIGMGSNVLSSIGTNEVWYGNPAKRKAL